jgi:hypothetical protein
MNGAMNELNMCIFHVKCLPYLRLVGVCIPIILNGGSVSASPSSAFLSALPAAKRHPYIQLGSLVKCCKLPHWGLGQPPTILVHFQPL